MYNLFANTRYQCPKCYTTFYIPVSACHTCGARFNGTRTVGEMAPDLIELKARRNAELAAAEAARKDEVKRGRRIAGHCELCDRPV